jgi:hypothetical protein
MLDEFQDWEATVKYICLIYADPDRLINVSREELHAVGNECFDPTAALRRSGQLIAAERLQPAQAAVTVRIRNGNTLVTESPHGETKEQLSGFYLIEARDLNQAIRVASEFPSAQNGSVEVRPVSE